MDGTNIRVIFKDGAVAFGGRTEDAEIPLPLLGRLNERFLPLATRLGEVFTDGAAVLYGEGYGAKIQKGGGNYRADQDFVLFDVRVGPWWLQRADVEDVAQKLGLDVGRFPGRGDRCEAEGGTEHAWGAAAYRKDQVPRLRGGLTFAARPGQGTSAALGRGPS